MVRMVRMVRSLADRTFQLWSCAFADAVAACAVGAFRARLPRSWAAFRRGALPAQTVLAAVVAREPASGALWCVALGVGTKQS